MTDNNRRNGIDLLKILRKYLKKWWVFVITIAIAVVFVKFKDKYEVPIYSLNSRLMVDKKEPTLLPKESTGGSVMVSDPVENQLALFESNSQIEKIINTLDFEVSYYAVGKLRTVEIYRNSPFIVSYDPNHNQPWNKEIHIKFITRDQFEIFTDPPIETINGSYKTGDSIKGSNYSFVVYWKEYVKNAEFTGNEYMFTINSINSLVYSYRWKLDISYDRNSSIITVSSTGRNVHKESMFLNALVEEFIRINLKLKNQTINSTIDFIDSQLDQIKGSLEYTEKRLETFRKSNDLMTLQDKAAPILERLNKLNKNKADQLMDLRYYEYLRDYLLTHDNLDDIVAPSTIGITMPLFTGMLVKLSYNYIEKEDLLSSSTPDNPVVINLETTIANQKRVLLENISNVIHITEMKIDDFDRQIEEKLKDYSKLPELESEYLDIQRYYTLDNSMYNFLLEKRAEAEIQRSSHLPDFIILDKASPHAAWKISPNTKSNYTRAVILAILIPGVILFLLFIFDKKICNINELLNYTTLPFAGKIPHNKKKSQFLVRDNPRSFFAQAFRLLRANLPHNKKRQTILVTSSVNDEGKSFISLNLAYSYAQTGKKVLLADFDFQHPSLSKLFNDQNETGLIHTEYNNLDILLPGVTSTSADEILQSEDFEELIKKLKKSYNYIIFDSSPLGLMADSLYLAKFADASVFVVRHLHTPVPVMDSLLQNMLEKDKLPNPFLVYNDVRYRMPVTTQKYYGMVEKTSRVDQVIERIKDQIA